MKAPPLSSRYQRFDGSSAGSSNCSQSAPSPSGKARALSSGRKLAALACATPARPDASIQ
jgi:hypothetical protein